MVNGSTPLKKIAPTVQDALDEIDADKISNTRIWDALGKTDPSATKQFKRAGGFSGTAIKPIWITRRLTELFGPCGAGWGVETPRFEVVHGERQEVMVYCTVAAWYREPGSPPPNNDAPFDCDAGKSRVYGVGGDKIVTHIKANEQYNRPERWENDDEAFKKAFTDAIGNAFKFIGVGADVHMGMFDDSKYVSELRKEFEGAANDTPKTSEPKPNARVTLDGPYTCPTQLMTAARQFVHTLNGMGDLAEFTEWKQTDDVKQFVNQLRRDLPDWWSGGPSVPADFVPLEILVAQKKRDLEQIDGLKEPA